MINTLEKNVFAAATFKDLRDAFLRQNKKACSVLWSVSVFFAFFEERRSKINKKNLFTGSKFCFPYVDI